MDNGGELANDEMRQLGNQYGKNIKVYSIESMVE